MKKLKDFLKENKEMTVFGLAWATLWRQWVLVMGFYAVMTILMTIFFVFMEVLLG